MSNVINKKTGQYLKSVHTPDYIHDDWIINPTEQEIEEYTIVVDNTEMINKEILIEDKKRELAINALKSDGILDNDGNIVK